MRILFISRWFPYPPDNGARIRVFNLIKYLSRRHEIALFSFAGEAISPVRLAALEPYCCCIHTVPYREFSPTRLRALLGFFSTRPRSVIDTYSKEMQTLIERVHTDRSFDIVVASQIESVPYALLLNSIPRVFEELELAVIREQFAWQRTLMRRTRYGLTWWKQQQYVLRLLRQVDGCTVVSEPERALLHKVLPGFQRLAVIPNGVNLQEYEGNWGSPAPNTLIFPGALTYRANFDAMDFFLKAVFPLIRARWPSATLYITGRTNGVPLHRLPLNSGVTLTGYLADVRPTVAQSQVCVAPLLTGGGTRFKILEAMALGTPVVSTGKGAEGLEATSGEDILIADEPADFADAVLRLLGDESLRAKLAANGRKLVRKRYEWDGIGKKLERFLCRVVETHAEVESQ
jgi:glycosyltransferase involved in cell wall biosynthesis